MDCIVSTYLTSGIDYQRGMAVDRDASHYIDNWYNSLVGLNLTGFVIQDSLSDEFMAGYPKITFYKVAKKPSGLSIYDYRWICHYIFLKDYKPEKVFFTDLHDVRVVRNPFPEMECGKLYCGDEEIPMINSAWIQASTSCNKLSKLKDFLDIIRSDRKLINCGLFGGCYEDVNTFLGKLTKLITELGCREPNPTVDMPLFIYTMYRYFGNSFIHGFPVNSIFGANEVRNDIWFIHK